MKKADVEKNSDTHANNSEKEIGFFTIDSLTSLSSLTSKIKQEETIDKIILSSDNNDIVRRFFQTRENWKTVTHFVIKASCFSLGAYQDNLLNLIKNRLLYLAIQVDLIEDPSIFVDNIYRYSALRYLEITAERYKETSPSNS